MKPVDNSASLNYNRAQANYERRNAINMKDADSLDAVLKNIRELLINGTKKLKTVTPEFIDQIYRFENLNDFSKQADIEELVSEQLETMERMRKRMKTKRGKSHKPSIYNQYGVESSGQANLLI